MTKIKQNDNVSPAHGGKKKVGNVGNGNPDSRKMVRTMPYNKNNREPKLIKIGQTLKKDIRGGKVNHGRRMVTQINSFRKRASGFSHTRKRDIADRDFAEKKTNDDTRELVLPSDSNVVKGNV
jgi:hypothetical protein